MNAGPATATLFFPLRPRHPSPCAARSSLFPFGPTVSLSRFASFTAGSSAILLFPLPRFCVLSCYLILYSTSGCTCFPRSWFHFFPLRLILYLQLAASSTSFVSSSSSRIYCPFFYRQFARGVYGAFSFSWLLITLVFELHSVPRLLGFSFSFDFSSSLLLLMLSTSFLAVYFGYVVPSLLVSSGFLFAGFILVRVSRFFGRTSITVLFACEFSVFLADRSFLLRFHAHFLGVCLRSSRGWFPSSVSAFPSKLLCYLIFRGVISLCILFL